MNKKQSPIKQNQSNQFKKNIQNYTISYCPKQFLGRSLYGEVRLGYQNNEKRVKAFRINTLPLSEQAKANLNLQKHYSQLSNCVRNIYQSVQSQSNRYTVMEYFPKTFKTQLAYFRKLTKNMEPYIQKFLQSYSKLYYYRITHGNISLDNIGISFDGKIKLMDFRPLDHLSFDEASMKDYRDFRNMICFILERDKTFPAKFEVFDDPNGNWQKLFSAWHIANQYEFIYREKKHPYQNMVVLLSKLENTIYPQDEDGVEEIDDENQGKIPKQKLNQLLRVGIRLLMLSNLKKITNKTSKITQQIEELQRILSPVANHDINFYNSMIWGAIHDREQFNIHQVQRLTLIMCLLPTLNQEYFFIQIIKEFQPNKEAASKFPLFSNSLIHSYSEIMLQNLISSPLQ